MPGFVDVHTHGQKGINVMNASNKDFKIWAENNFAYGVTSFFSHRQFLLRKNKF